MQKVILRPWTLLDVPDLISAISNPKVLANLRDGIPYPYTESDAVQFINMTATVDKNKAIIFAICYDDKAIGNIGVYRREGQHRLTAELGYYIGESYWGKGIMAIAIKQMCDFIFQNTDIVRIFAEPFITNPPSARVLEKAGFQIEGILRKNCVKNGVSIDMKLYSKISE
jgi:RimJ/RimL family protein N-acetyltransferase